jgi:hypothetical protein
MKNLACAAVTWEARIEHGRASSVVFCISYDTLPLIEGRTMKRAAPHDFYSCIHSSGAETCNRKCDTHLTNAYPTTYPFVLATV